MRIKADLWEHQERMLNFTLDHFRSGVPYVWWVAGCGVGKTLAAINVVKVMSFKRVLVLTKKAAIRSAWATDFQDFLEDVDYVLLDTMVSTPTTVEKSLKSAKQKAEFIMKYPENDKPLFVVVNYETARIMADTLQKMQFDFVIADESHKLKSHNSKQSQKLTKALMRVPYKLIMTGTGWSDRPTDVYGQVRFLAPIVAGKRMSSVHLGTWSKFFERYVNYYEHEHIKIARSYKNLDHLQDILNAFTLHIDNEEVLDLPEAIHQTRLLTMPSKMKKAYKALEDEMVAEIGDDLLIANNRLTQSLRLHQLTGGFYPTEDGELKGLVPIKDNPKLQAVADIVDEIDGKPLVIFTRFKQDVVLLSDMLTGLGLKVKKLVGGVHEHVEWQAGEGDVLIANLQAGGTGVNLTRARYCIYYSVGHSRTDYEQSLWRIRRAGSDVRYPITYFHLLMNHTVDTEIQRGLEGKGRMSDFLLKGIINRL